jgi:hypothetical protein
VKEGKMAGTERFRAVVTLFNPYVEGARFEMSDSISVIMADVFRGFVNLFRTTPAL